MDFGPMRFECGRGFPAYNVIV